MVLPQKSAAATEFLFTPPRLLTILVALALAAGAAIELVIAGQVAPPATIASWFRPLAYAIGVTFLLRAIGERRYVGFFKRVRGTEFSRWDDRLFSPLCVGISLATFALAFSVP